SHSLFHYTLSSYHHLHLLVLNPPTIDLLSFFVNDPSTTEIYTLSLHDALPICKRSPCSGHGSERTAGTAERTWPETSACDRHQGDRKSTRLNSSHVKISYAVFCLKKKNKIYIYKKTQVSDTD